MFSKNLKYYRLKKNLSKKDLANMVGITSMAISYYENGERYPSMDIIKNLSVALGVKVSDFLNKYDDNLVFHHGEFRKSSKLSLKQQEYIRESVEEYVNRYYSIVDILGGNVLPDAPLPHQISISGNVEKDAMKMRKYLGVSEFGPVSNLIELLENKGVIIYVSDIDCDAFSGMNGLINNRPYIIVNGNMSPERIRSTISHELAHLIFIWDEYESEKEIEKIATAIGGAFLFPCEDAIRELGIRRSRITNDMKYICKEYGVSMYMLVKRANMCRIINDNVAKEFYINASKAGWKKNEPIRIEREEPLLFSQLVFRAVCEDEISIQKGAELLKMPYSYVEEQCFGDEV